MSEIDWDTPEIAVRYDKNCDHQFLKGRALVEMMGIATGDTVLDVGCGTGRQAVYVSWIIGPSGSSPVSIPPLTALNFAGKNSPATKRLMSPSSLDKPRT